MAFCGNCGTKVEDGVKFCPGCGAGIAAQAQPNTAPPQANEQQAYQQQAYQQTYQQAPPNASAGAQQDAKDVTYMFDPNDIEKNKAMGILGYLIFFIPLLAAKDSPYAKFHANQGFLIFLGYILCSVLWIIPILGWIAAPICYVVITVLAVMGLIHSLGGKAKRLPIIGKITIFK